MYPKKSIRPMKGVHIIPRPGSVTLGTTRISAFYCNVCLILPTNFTTIIEENLIQIKVSNDGWH